MYRDVTTGSRRMPHDLVLVLALATVLVPVALLGLQGLGRIALGLVFILFCPGYVLTAALFPKDSDLDWIERLALSFGLSIAVVPLIGLGLNFTPYGLSRKPSFKARLREVRMERHALFRRDVRGRVQTARYHLGNRGFAGQGGDARSGPARSGPFDPR